MNEKAVPLDPSVDISITALPQGLEGMLKKGDIVIGHPNSRDRTIVIAPAERMSPFGRLMEAVAIERLDRLKRGQQYTLQSTPDQSVREIARIKRADTQRQEALTQALVGTVNDSLRDVMARRKQQDVAVRQRVMARKRRGI